MPISPLVFTLVGALDRSTVAITTMINLLEQHLAEAREHLATQRAEYEARHHLYTAEDRAVIDAALDRLSRALELRAEGN